MKCYYHTKEDAVGQCKRCGKHLCKDCFDFFGTEHICYECGQIQNLELRKTIIGQIITGSINLVAFIVGLIMFANGSNVGLVIFILSGLLPAWFATNKFYGLLYINEYGVACFSFLRLLVKLLLAAVISPVVLIVNTIMLIVNIVRFNQNKKIIIQNAVLQEVLTSDAEEEVEEKE